MILILVIINSDKNIFYQFTVSVIKAFFINLLLVLIIVVEVITLLMTHMIELVFQVN